MGELRQKLSLAALALVSAGGPDVVRAEQSPWELDTSFLSYVEADDRVSVSKTLANLTRLQENGSVSVNLVHDTMSGASPTGAIRSSESAVTFTSASGGGEVNTIVVGIIQKATSRIRVFRPGLPCSGTIDQILLSTLEGLCRRSPIMIRMVLTSELQKNRVTV